MNAQQSLGFHRKGEQLQDIKQYPRRLAEGADFMACSFQLIGLVSFFVLNNNQNSPVLFFI